MNKKWIFGTLPFLLVSCNHYERPKYLTRNWHPADGYVADSATAIKIAQAIMFEQIGEEVLEYKRLNAKLEGGNSWMVWGALPLGDDGAPVFGGYFQMRIDKKNGAVTEVEIGK
ncbi:NTF2 fold immunity protein [Hymenobacter sp. BRD67]|uniref:NTF2 fold immunity protein n=1 Tax=Hymenobacter sp. BRD67 TaxID=2675877 RepID=UPI0015660B8D|nr:NTF2 fold immunity protein [Hymenobacter sp. BRD67]QKG53446.1 hypothetical protein GKZ67_13645 [Hymenobacter sp. BRD67]